MPRVVQPMDGLIVFLFRQLDGEQQDGHAFNRSSRNTMSYALEVRLVMTLCGQERFEIPLIQNLVERIIFWGRNLWTNGPCCKATAFRLTETLIHVW